MVGVLNKYSKLLVTLLCVIMPSLLYGENWITHYSYGMSSSIKNIEDYKPNVTFGVRVNVNNMTNKVFNGYLRLAITDKADNIKEWISNRRYITLKAVGFTYDTYNSDMNCLYTIEPAIGDRIRLFYSTDEINWIPMSTDPRWNNTVWEIPVAELYTIGETTSVEYDDKEKVLIVTYEKGVKPTLLHNGMPVTNRITSDSTKLVANIAGMIGSKLVLRIVKDKELEELEISVE